MKNLLIALLLLTTCAVASARDYLYEGTWLTTNRKLDGTMTCVVTELGSNRWRGHFYGVWQGVSFSYKVEFHGPPEQVRGEAVIDGADYQWTGALRTQSPGWFKGSFTGSRYLGSFNLKEKAVPRK